MKIGLITGEYPPMQGGVGDFTRELGTALAGLGHEVHVVTRVGCAAGRQMTRDESPATRHTRGGTPVTVHPVVPTWGWRSYRRVMELARDLSLDLLNVQYQAAAYDLHPAVNFYPLLAARLPAWCAKLGLSAIGRARAGSAPRCTPIVVTFHDLKVPYLFPKAGPLREWVVTLLARHANAAIITNRADELVLTARGVGRVERIPIGSNIAPDLPINYDRQRWRAQLGIAPEELLLGFFGFFNARKGVETLLRALAALDETHHLLFIGGTVGSSDATNRAYADRMTALTAELGLSDRVHYTGYVSPAEVSAAFAALDLCVLPYADGISFHHGTLMAALAHSQPIVSTRPPIELPELVHGENVWLVPPADPHALGAAISSLSADPEARQRLARGAARLAGAFTWERIASRTADLFESLRA